jgi:hypothetical protein
MKNVSTLIFLVFSACASVPEPPFSGIPEWVQHPEKFYSVNRYLTAVGTGSSRDEAARDAKKQLAESFIVKVQSTTRVNSASSLNQNTSGNLSGDSKQNISKEVSLESNVFLRGAEVKETAVSGSEHYALLALDKLSARSGLMLEATRIQGALGSELDQLEQNYTAAGVAHAKSLLSEFQELHAEASALGMAALVEVSPLQSRLGVVEAAARNRNQKIAFTVITNKGEDFFERDLQSCINDRGGRIYEIASAPKEANQVKISVVERSQHMKLEGWVRIRFDLTASLTTSDGRLYRIQTSQTDTGRSRDAVLENVSDKLSKDLCEQLFNRVGEMK